MFWILALALAAVTAAWLRYRWVHRLSPRPDESPGLSDRPGPRPWGMHSHQSGAQWLHQIFERSAAKYPDFPALTVAASGETFTYRELDQRAGEISALITPMLDQADQVVAIYMTQDHADAVASHLAILKAGAVQLFIDPETPEAVIQDMLTDAKPVVLLTRGAQPVSTIPCIDLLSCIGTHPGAQLPTKPPAWLDNPADRLASIFYTSGTTGKAKGVECPHAGYINLAKSYASYFDFVAGHDATTLSSSLGYDGSISEIYSAWVAGAEVVMLSKSELRSGPDLLPTLKAREVTALFCPPILLSTLTANPAQDLPYPICRYVIPAGEAFPASLVEPWTEGRRQVINTYGPTEVSTDTSRQMLRPGEPVTIGTPFAGVSYFILSPSDLQPVPIGEAGELCIGGCQLARGYRNLDAVTAEKFITHPSLGRLYRSGDRCHMDPDSGRIHFHGRIDTQLKVRGFRVETQPIESLLQDEFSEIETAVLDCQNDELIAFIKSAQSERPAAGAQTAVALLQAPWIERAQESLRRKFPTYAVPSRYFQVESFNLVPASGKIDRRALPNISAEKMPSRAPPSVSDEDSRSSIDQVDEDVLQICRSVLGDSLSLEDEFINWGAHSIAIAQLSQKLQSNGYPISVRDLLGESKSARGVAALARLRGDAEPERARTIVDEVDELSIEDYQETFPILDFRWFSVLQALGIVILRLPLLLVAVAALGLSDAEAMLLSGDLMSFLILSGVGFGIYLALPFLNLGWVKILKSVESSHSLSLVRPGRYAKFSTIHLRCWWIEQQQSLVLRPAKNMVRSPRIFRWFLQHLGATIANSAHIAQSVELMGPLTLITFAKGAIVQSSAHVSTIRWEQNALVLAEVYVGREGKVGTRATLAAGASLGDESWLTPLSSLDGAAPDRTLLTGVPADAVAAHRLLRRVQRVIGTRPNTVLRETRNVSLQVLLEFALVIAPMGMTALISLQFLGFDAIQSLVRSSGKVLTWEVFGLLGSAIVGIWLSILSSSILVSLFVRLTGGHIGAIDAESISGVMARYRQQKMNQLQQFWTWSLTGQYLRALSGVRFTRIGGSECDTMTNLLPDLLDAGANVFFAHGCFCNVLDEEGPILTLRVLQAPENYFASNNSVSENGALPGNLLLGVSTSLGPYWARQQSRVRPDSARVLAGNPPLEFGAGGLISSAKDGLPSFPVFLMRVLFSDIGSTGAIPGIGIFLGIVLLVWAETLGLGALLSTGLAALMFAVALPLVALLIKWVLVGARWGVDHTTPFWSMRHFTYFLAQDFFFQWSGIFLASAEGTALANPLLRAFGCRIGKRTIFAHPIQAFDWHAVDIGENCIINGQLQLHSFEGRVLTVRRSRIGDETCINQGAMLMGGADIERSVTIRSQALVLKGMHLKSGVHSGNPSQPLDI